MDSYKQNFMIALIIAIVVLIIVGLLFILHIVNKTSNKTYKNVIFPTYKASNEKRNTLAVTGNVKGQKNKKDKNKKYGKFSLKKKFLAFLSKKGLDKKFKSWYVQGGHYDKTIEDFVDLEFKALLLGVIVGVALKLAFGNIWVALGLGVIFIFLPPIDMLGNIQDRRNAFRRDFPYFLQTLSFVLSNGSNMSVAFYEVTNKQSDGVLKEVMLDVISTQKVNGGDFTTAFASIIDKVNIDETREFVEIVQNNLEKGVSVAETFSSQSDTITRFVKNKKIKKIKNVSNKILIPILIVIVAIGIFFF